MMIRRGPGGPRSGVLGLLVIMVFSSTALPDSPVADAAMSGDVDAVRELLREGADVNAAQGDGMTALHWAAERIDEELTSMLIYAGANVSAITRIGDYTPLHLASKNGGSSVVEKLLDAGADPSAKSSAGGAGPLHFAAAGGAADVIAILIDRGADPNVTEDEWDQTPLMFASARNRVDAIQVLVARSADIAITSRVVDVPTVSQANRAASQRRREVLASFRGEDAVEGDGHAPSPSQVQAAVKAAQEFRAPEAAPIVEDSVDFEERSPTALSYAELVGRHGGLTALLHAVREGHLDAIGALIEAGADINQVSAGDRTSPLLMAVINGHFDLAVSMLENGADVNVASDAGTTPLFSAINTHWAPKARYPQQQAYRQQQTNYLQLMEALLEAGAEPNVRLTRHLWYMAYTFDQLRVNLKGATPFWRAAYATDVEAMRLLVAHGADPNISTEKTPARRYGRRGGQEDMSGLAAVPVGGPAVYAIHAATGVGYGEGFAGNQHRHVPDGWLPAARYLIEEIGMDVNTRDHNGYTPLHHAAARGDNEMIHYLVEQGANVMVVSRRGQTTVDMANGPVQRIQPFPETIVLLESFGAINNHNCLSC